MAFVAVRARLRGRVLGPGEPVGGAEMFFVEGDPLRGSEAAEPRREEGCEGKTQHG